MASQKQMQAAADRRVLDACKVFNEIQSGPNPLTRVGVRRMILGRDGQLGKHYGLFEAWACPGSGLCPVCGEHVTLTGRTKEGRWIGSCGDAFSNAKWDTCPDCDAENNPVGRATCSVPCGK